MLAFTSLIFLIWRMKLMGSNPPTFQKDDNPSAFMESRFLRVRSSLIITNIIFTQISLQVWSNQSILLQVINYNYIYSLNIWLLLNPWWLCFDWAMGCIPLITKIDDMRVIAPLSMWIGFLLLAWKSKKLLDSHFGRSVEKFGFNFLS